MWDQRRGWGRRGAGAAEQSVEMEPKPEGHPGKPYPRKPSLSASLTQEASLARHGARRSLQLENVQAAALDRSSEKLEKRPWYILNPEAKGMGYWDALTTVALIFTAIVTPVEVSFLPAPTSALDPLFCINRLVDAVFIVDMALQFFLMVKSEKPEGLTMQVEWEYRLPNIAMLYLKGWFVLDFLSIAPMAFDIIPVVNAADGSDESSAASPPRAAKAVRVVRILRLIKLIRLIRSSRILKRWELRISLPSAVVTLVTLIFGVLVISHWIACVLSLQTTIEGDPASSWWGTFGYCQYSDVELQTAVCADSSERYLSALYWSWGIILGFAAKPEAGPFEPIQHGENDRRDFLSSETVIYLLLQFAGALLWTYVLAKCVDMVANHNPDAKASHQRIDALNRYCSFFELPSSESQRLREYFREMQGVQLANSRQAVMDFFSPKLQKQQTWKANEHWLRKIALLNEPLVGMKQRQEQALFFQCPLKIHGYDCPCRRTCTTEWHQNMLVQVAMAMQPAVYVPREELPASRLCTSGRLEPRTGRLVPFVPSRVCSGPALLQM